MKRLIALVLALILTLAAVPALGEGMIAPVEYPILGAWYLHLAPDGIIITDETKNLRVFSIICFEENGQYTTTRVNWNKDMTFEISGPKVAGTWSQVGFTTYELRSETDGVQMAVIIKDELFMPYGELYMLYHRCEPVDYTTDVILLPSAAGGIQ